MPINDSSAYQLPSDPESFPEEHTLGKYVSMELPDEVVAMLNEVMRATGDTTESLFRRSLGLYKFAVDAKLDGYKLAVVDPEDNRFVEDIPGL